MPLGYRQVKDMYDSLASAGVVTKPLADWSREMNESLGTDLYSEGQNDSWIKRTSVGIDRLLEMTGLPQAGEEIGRSVGELVGNPEAGAAIGGGLPRMGVNMLPMFLPGPGWVGAAGMGALSGAEAYTSTGSPTAGIIGGVTAGVMPKVAELAEQAALRGLGGRLVKGDYYGGTPIQMAQQAAAGAPMTAINKYFPETISQGILSQGAGQLAAGGLMVGSGTAQQVAAGEPVHVSPTELLLNLTLGQAPFAGAYLAKGGRVKWGGAATRSHVAELENAMELTRGLKNFNENKTEISNKPGMAEIVDPPGSTAQEGDANTRINDIRLQTKGLEQEGSALGQERQDKLTDQESALVKLQGAQPGHIFGAQVRADTPRTEVTGTILDEKPGWRRIQVADDPRNGELAGKQIGYFTKDEPPPTAATPLATTLPPGITVQARNAVTGEVLYTGGIGTTAVLPAVGMEIHSPGGAVGQITEVLGNKKVMVLWQGKTTPTQMSSGYLRLPPEAAVPPGALPVTQGPPGVKPGETQTFGVPQGHWAEFYQKELSSAAGDLVRPGEFDAGRALTEADQAVAAAKSGADLQGAVVKLNGVRAHYGEAPIDDVALANILETRKVGDERAAIRAAINDTRRLMDANEEAGLQNKLVAQRDQVVRDLETAPEELRGDLEAQLGDLNARIDKGHEPTAKPLVEPPPISYVPSKQSEQTGQVPVSVDIAKLDAAHGKAYPEERVGPGAEGGNRERYDKFARWVDSGQPMEMPVMTLDADGQPRFFRGSHRFAVIRDRGHKTMEVTVPAEQAEKFRAAFAPTEGVKPEPGKDRAYLAAVQSGDLETAQRMTDEAANANNYGPEKWVHDTYAPEFESFKVGGPKYKGQEVTSADYWKKNISGAAMWFRPEGGKGLIGHQAEKAKKGQERRSVNTYLQMLRPLWFDASMRQELLEQHGVNKEFPAIIQPSDVQKLKSQGYDSVVYYSDGKVREAAVFDPEQIKSRDPVTYDKQGNVIPLSQRFNPETKLLRHEPRDTMADVAKIEEVPHADSPATVPLTQLEVEKATRITQGTPYVEDQRKFIDFAQDGLEAFKKNYGMDQAALEAWVRQPHVAEWTGKLADTMEVPSTPPTRKIGKERVFTPETEQDLEFARRVGSNGRDLNKSLSQSQDPVIRALAQDLARHDAALGAIDVHLRDMDTSFADLGDDGRAVLKLRASLRHEDAGSQDTTMMHELLHGLTLHELQNPANAEHVTALDALRQRVIDSLPKSMRDVANDMQKTDWYLRYGEGGAKWEDYKGQLGDTFHADMHTIYGVLNNDEFISQGLTSQVFRDHLARLKAPDGTSVYSKFVDFIKNVLGLRTEGSVLEQLMGRTDDLIGARNFQATAREYGERYFQNQGLTPKLATKQAERAVALMRGANEEAIQWMGLQKVDTPEIVKATKELQEFMATPQSATSRQALGEIGYDPNEASITQFATDLVLGKAKDADMALRVLDPKVSAYVYAKVRDLSDLLGMVDNATRPEVGGRVGIADPAKMREFAVGYLDNANKALDAERQFVKDTTAIQDLNGVSPAGFLDKSMRRPEPGPADPPEVDTPQKKLAMLEKLFANANFIAQVSQEAKEWVSRSYQLESNAKKMKLTALQALGMDEKGKFTKEFLRTLQDPQVERAASKWMLQNYEKGKETGIQMLGRDDADVRQVLNSVPEGKRQAVEHLVTSLTQAGQVHMESIMNKMTDVELLNGAIKIAPVTKLKVAQNMEISKRMLDIAMSDMSNPQVQMENSVKLRALQQELGPAAFDGLLQISKNSAEMLQKQRAFNEANPGWTTMRKYGAYELQYRKGNQILSDKVNSEQEARQLVAERGGQIVNLKKSQDRPDTPIMFGIPELQALQARQADLLRDVMPPDAVEEMVGQTEAPGYEDASFVRNHIGWIEQSSSYWTRKLFKTQTEALRNEPELMQREDILGMLDLHSQNMLNPDPVVGGQIRRILSTWMMGLNPASVMGNGTQLFTRGASEMTNLTGKPIDSFKRMINGFAEATGLSKPPAHLAEERKWLDRQIREESIVSAFNEGDPGNDGMEALQRALGRGRAQSKGQQLDGIHKAINQKALWMFQQVEKINSKGALTAAFDLHMEQDGVRQLTGKAYEDARQAAYEKAKGFNQTVNNVGGKADRPIWLSSGKNEFTRNAGSIMMAMQTYNVGTINQIANYIRKGFYDPAGLKPGEKHNARVALVQLLAVQTALAGVLGVPFAGAAVAAINQVFPELEVNKNIKKWTNMLFAGDAEQGNVISDVAMNGIPSMFGWDMKSRLSMGNLLPGVSEFNGFHPETLAGPAVNLGAQLFKGVGQAIAGQPGEALVTLMPPALKKFVNLAMDGYKIRDYNDRPVLDPTGGEMVGMALGFQPTRLTEWNTAQRIALGAERMEAQRKKVFTQGLANQALEGKFGDIKQTLRQKVQEDPNFKWEDAARSAARAAVELQFPRDLRREGSGSEQYAKTLRMFNMNVDLPTEMQRKQFEAQVLQNLGLRMDQRSLRRAQTVDVLRAQNPRMTRYELNRLADAADRRQGLPPMAAEVGAAGSLP